jgi:butyryl-CoA dehydrogenase
MNFQLTEEQSSLQAMARQFSVEHLAPFAQQWDETSTFPVETLKRAAQLGMAAMNASESMGGVELLRLESSLVFEQLATGCIATAAYLSIHNMVVNVLDHYGSDELKQKFGWSLAQMEQLASYCLTEPEAGSDAASLKTSAMKTAQGYCLNGAKAFISGAGVSDVYLCMARTGDASYRGISCFLIEKNTPGLSFGTQEHKMGWRAQPTAMVYFENCIIPHQHLVGEEGQGFQIALNALNGGRIHIASCSLGGALACLHLTQSYMKERKQFGKPLSQMPVLRAKFADMLADYESARLMVHRAAHALDEDQDDAPYWCAMAKRYATDAAFRISDQALQLHGGYGYLRDYQIERIFRDLRVHQILEGTNEIMREIMAKSAFDKDEITWLKDEVWTS